MIFGELGGVVVETLVSQALNPSLNLDVEILRNSSPLVPEGNNTGRHSYQSKGG